MPVLPKNQRESSVRAAHRGTDRPPLEGGFVLSGLAISLAENPDYAALHPAAVFFAWVVFDIFDLGLLHDAALTMRQEIDTFPLR